MKTWNRIGLVAALLIASAMSVPAAEQTKLDQNVADTIQLFKNSDSNMEKLFQSAVGYAVFPEIGKTGIGIGGAEGRGQLFENGQLTGKTKMKQLTLGPQLGGQKYAEVIFFETDEALNAFKENRWTMSAEASAVAAAEGVSAVAKYRQGVLVFTAAKTGLMLEASIGRQKFEYKPVPVREVPDTPRG